MKQPPVHEIYSIRTLKDLLRQAADRYTDQPALQSKKEGVWRRVTYRQLAERVQELATTFAELGVEKGDRVAVLSENRTEWAIAYLASVTAGFVIVPVDKDLSPREITHVLNFAGVKVLVCSKDYLDRLQEQRNQISRLECVISMEEECGWADLSFSQALKKGRESLEKSNRFFERTSVDPEDLAAIIFTSGTTGSSKGVMLTHKNIASNLMGTSRYVSVKNGVFLSVLPLHHTYECTGGFLLALYQGATIAHAENLRRIPENLQETGATIMLGVPLLFESLYRRIEGAIKEKGEGKFRLAKGLASASERLLRINIRRKLFKQVHEKLGGRLRLFISGGAAIDPQVAKGFRELGINFIQGYGMTEASPIISVNRVNCFKDASVGLPLPGVEVKVVEGEITVRGDTVMRGYFLNEAATKETLQDGWLRTGDLGYFDADGFLYISGRKKSVIVTPSGKNVYPEEVEAALNQSPYVLESLVWGGPEEDPSEVEVQAIIVPRRETFDEEFGAGEYDEEKVRQVISAEVKKQCQDLAHYKRVRKFVIRNEEFEKTTTRKIKRFLYTGKPRRTAAEPDARAR